ncbi:KN57gp_066 [Dikerogammarus haemobaphes nudivirus]|nr:KN57gp_066 [Dikerogammarus haemobaphes nudivirus]
MSTTTNKPIYKKIEMVIKIDENDDDSDADEEFDNKTTTSSSDEGVKFSDSEELNFEIDDEDYKLVFNMKNTAKVLDEIIETRNQKQEELKKINILIEDAANSIVNIPTPVQYCKELTLNTNLCNKRITESKVVNSTTQKKVYLPYYIGSVNFNNISWIPYNEDSLDIVKHTNTSKWISSDYNPLLDFIQPSEEIEEGEYESTVEERFIDFKNAWIVKFNAAKYLGSFAFHDEKEFIMWEICYLKDPKSNNKCLTGMTFLKCSVKHNIVVIDDICNVKISTNHRNSAQGDMYHFLVKKYQYIKIYMYTPENTSVEMIFKSMLWPWSGLIQLLKYRIFNMISYLNLESTSNVTISELCLDSHIHSKSCSTCNVLNLLYKTSNNQFSLRKNNNGSVRLLFRDEELITCHTKTVLYNRVVCKHVTFLEYGKTYGDFITRYCNCHSEDKKRKLNNNDEVKEGPNNKKMKM